MRCPKCKSGQIEIKLRAKEKEKMCYEYDKGGNPPEALYPNGNYYSQEYTYDLQEILELECTKCGFYIDRKIDCRDLNIQNVLIEELYEKLKEKWEKVNKKIFEALEKGGNPDEGKDSL